MAVEPRRQQTRVQIASEGLKGRVIEVSLADLQKVCAFAVFQDLSMTKCNVMHVVAAHADMLMCESERRLRAHVNAAAAWIEWRLCA